MSELDPKLLELLGRLTVEFQTLELLLKGFAGAVLEAPSVKAEIVFAELPFSKLMDVCSALFLESAKDDDDLKCEFKELMSRCQQVGEARNNYIHSHWMFRATNDGSLPLARIKIRAKSKGVQRTFAEDDHLAILSELVERNRILNFDFLQFMIREGTKGTIEFEVGKLS